LLETPFTKAKRKAVLEDTTEEDNIYDNDENAHRALDVSRGTDRPVTALADPFTPQRQPLERTGKVAKTSNISTPSQQFTERLKGNATSLPTPPSMKQTSLGNTTASNLQDFSALDVSPTPIRSSDRSSPTLTRESSKEESDLTKTILETLRSDNIKLKASTEMQLRHEIELKLDVDNTTLRRYKETISKWGKRIDELEDIVDKLT
jgi:hypothetical protein